MEKRKLLFVTSELTPFNDITEIAQKISDIPNHLASNGLDVRILMPRFGTINERRHRLHEVVRLSGINVMFNDEDFALTVKVASLPNSKHRLQVYFLHNDEFFKRRYDYLDENETFFEDNSERMIFFNRGVMETLKKFGWAPDFIVCNGWMTSLIPLYARTLYSNDPVFSDSKIFFNIFKKDNECKMEDKFIEKALLDKNIATNKAEHYASSNFDGMCKGAIHYSDGLIVSSSELHEELLHCINNSKKPVFNLEDNGLSSIELSNFIKESKPVAKGA
jgi:starch synthase